MKHLAEVVEALLIYAAAYPVTLWNLIFRPSRLFHAAVPDRVCPPAVAYAITVMLVYYWFRASDPAARLEKLPKWVDEKFVIVFAGAYVGIIANLQQLGIARIGNVTTIAFVTQLGSLVYAICPVFLASLVVLEAMTRWKEWLASAFILVNALYFWCLVNVCRAAFGFSGWQAIKGAAYAYVGFLLGALIMTALGGLVLIARKQSTARRPQARSERAAHPPWKK